MAKKIYVYACYDCEVSWEKEYPWGKPAEKTKCPDCSKRCGQDWANRTPTPVHFKGAGWTGKNSVTGLNKRGGSDEVNLKLQESCKDRMATGWQHYAKFSPKQQWIDDHTTGKVSETKARQKMKAAKKMSDAVYDKAGIDKSAVHKKKPQ